MLTLLSVRPASGADEEYAVKAAYLFHFIQFIQWPSHAFAEKHQPLVIGVVGDDPFGQQLAAVVRGESARGHPLVLRTVTQESDLRAFHLLFISASEEDRWNEIFAITTSAPVLLISDRPGFCRQGGHINFYQEAQTVRFEMNAERLREDGFVANSRVLKLAKIVNSSRSRK